MADGLRLFLNYRRSDASREAHRLHELLVLQPGTDRVFIDVGGIEPGTDFAAVIDEALADTDVVLAVIGETWLTAESADGRRRLDDPDDFVRKELEKALDLNLPIIPVLVRQAAMPAREELPATLGELTGHQAFDELHGERWLDTVRGPLIEFTRRRAGEGRERRARAASDLRTGALFGPLRLDELLEDDPGAQRYRAYDTGQDRSVIVEIRSPVGRDEADTGFSDTAATLATIEDPHLVPILDYGEHDGRPYLVTALPEGVRLPALTAVSALSVTRAVAAVEDVATALEALRASGFGGIQLRPADVWLTSGASGAAARLLPFGAFPGRQDPRYSAPERLRGKQFDERADVYALTCLLFECLSGGPPFPGSTAEAVIIGHLRKPRPHLTDAPAALDAVVRRGLAKKPAERIATPRTLVVSARAALGGPPAVLPVPAVSTPGRIVDQFVDGVGTLRARGARARAGMSTPALRVGATLALLSLATCWVAGALWLGGARNKQPGDPFVIDGPDILIGLLGYVFLVALTGGITGVVTFLIAVIRARRRTPSWEAAFEVPSKRPAATVGGLAATYFGVFLPLVALASVVRHRQVPEPLLGDVVDYALGFAAMIGLMLLALYSATCWFALQERAVHTSRTAADRQFPLFVGAVALVAAALAVAVGGWVGIGVAGVVIVLCIGCLVVEVFDRASSLGAYLGGVVMTVAAGGGAVAAFTLL